MESVLQAMYCSDVILEGAGATMIYGYTRATINEYGLAEMKEITFAMSPTQLRTVAQFLLDMAGEMEAGAFTTCSHRHLTTTHPEWNDSATAADIIVMPPAVAASE